MKPHSGNKYVIIGAMSGTSLDGLDLAAVEFYLNSGNNWAFTILASETIPYSKGWEKKIKTSPALTGEQLLKLHNSYGRYTGKEIKKFIQRYQLKPELIASHGHTIFHQPDQGFTFQLGNGFCIAAETGIPTVSDFRSGDVALHGQGAPLVPAGDRLLFSEYESCLNLGGFANISFEKNNLRIAFDICPVNFILNYLASLAGKPYDEYGNIGRKGTVDPVLLTRLNQLDYYQQQAPKSLGREWMDRYFFPIINAAEIPVSDKLRTVYEHIAMQINEASPKSGSMLITGGGAFNSFLIECFRKKLECKIIIPSAEIVNYKEALIFAFLGLMRYLGKINCFASVTGAKRDSSAGVIFY